MARRQRRQAARHSERLAEVRRRHGRRRSSRQQGRLEYSSHREALDDYVSDASESDLRQLADEIREFLILNESDQMLKQSAATLGLGILPPKGVRLRPWLADVREILLHARQG
ncbi:contact-dependent growth inhibition system immunity protein [Streptomyces sp. NPDC048269]|uniref:contact-dependent growth inhibition system immunity protein n=1 Tax=Streptomyces sp. NPDC048269 TaxID=3155753 RepID=UPI003424F20E